MIRTSCRIPHVVFFVAVVSLALTILLITPALATVPVSPGVNLVQLQAEVAALQTTVNTLQNTVNSQASTITTLQGTVNTLQNTVNSQASTITSLQAKTAPISIANGVGTNTEMFLTGVNLHIVNGLGATDGTPSDPINSPGITNGLGNLIIGYNLSRTFLSSTETDTRTGSHNLILGDMNNYSSYGGIVDGQFNNASGEDASVLGGQINTASGQDSVITAGENNQTTGALTAILGGDANTASGLWSVVVGGANNSATGQVTGGYSVVVGGQNNLASGQYSVVTGGNGNTASGADGIAP